MSQDPRKIDLLALFEMTARPHPLPASVVTSNTSVAAAESIRHATPHLRRQVFTVIATRPQGATCDEIEVALEMTHQTASARVNELMRAGAIIDSGQRRRTRSGRAATVWVRKAGA